MEERPIKISFLKVAASPEQQTTGREGQRPREGSERTHTPAAAPGTPGTAAHAHL